MQKKITIVLTLLVVLFSLNSYARSDDRSFVSPGMAMTGGKLFFAAIERSMYTDCQEQNADMWDMEQKVRERNYKCVNVFKDFHDFSGLNQYKKADALAKASYSKLKRALISESLAAGGSGEPPEGCDAHHIVPEHDNRPWARKFVEPSRKILAGCNIDINSVENGVFLPRSESTKSDCTGTFHRSMHDELYYTKVFTELDNALNNGGGCSEVKNTLRLIKEDLINGAI